MNAENLEFCDVQTALEEVRAGRVLAVVDDEENLLESSLVMASAEPSPDVLRYMVSATSGLAFMAVNEIDLRRVKLPASLEGGFTLGAVFPRVSGRMQPRECTRAPLGVQIIPFTARKAGVLRHARPAECIADLARSLSGDRYCFFSTFSTANHAKALQEVVQATSMKVLSIAELIRYRLLREQHVRSKSAFLVKSRYGEFQFRCVESDVFDRCAVLIKGDEHEFRRCPPLARIERIQRVGGMCTCLPTCVGRSFEDTVEMMHRDGHGIIVFMPSMSDCSTEEAIQKFTMEYFEDDPFSTLEDSCIHRITSAGVCAQILHHLGAECVRIVSNRPHRMKDLEAFGIQIIEEVGTSKSRLTMTLTH